MTGSLILINLVTIEPLEKFKEEFSGRGFVGTSSKSYICLGEDGDDKVGAKGVNKRQNKLTFET